MKHHPASPNYCLRFTLCGNVVFDPFTMAIVATTVSAAGAIQKAEADANAYKREADVADENARIARVNAERTGQAYSLQEDKLRRSQKLALARQRGASYESGVGGNTGSNLDIQVEDSAQAELDALTLRYEGQNERNNRLNESINFQNSAATSRTNAKVARRAGYMDALAIGASGGAKAGSYNARLSEAKAPSSGTPWQSDVQSGKLARNRYVTKYDWES